MGIMVNVNCQIDRVQNNLKDEPLDMPVGD